MMGNTNENIFNNDELFVDNALETADTVDDSDDFYEDEIIERPIDELKFDNDISDLETENNFVSQNNDVKFGDFVDTIEEQPTIDEKPFDGIVDSETINETEEPVFVEPLEMIDNKEIEVNPIEEKVELKEESEVVEEPKSFITNIDTNLTQEEMDKMIAEDSKSEELDDSYVLSNFDVLFDSLYNDVNGANNFISNLIEQKKSVNLNEAELNEQFEKLEKEKEEFAKQMEAQKEAIENEKAQCNEYVKGQKARIQNEEEQFNADMQAAKEERELAEQSLKIEREKFEDEKAHFEKYKEIEEQKLDTEKQKLEAERQQFNKEKEIELEKINNGHKELETQKEQFAKSKELEEKKLELESKNLSQSCARFKELVSQFNSGFQQLPEENK